MDLLASFLLGVAVTVVGGIIVARQTDWLTQARTKREQDQQQAVSAVDHCMEIFGARLAYIRAFHKAPHTAPPLKNEHERLQSAYWWAKPKTVVDSEVWAAYMRAEKGALDRDSGTLKERMNRVETEASAVLDWLTAKRETELRR